MKRKRKSSAVERLKDNLLKELSLTSREQLESFWRQARWPKPDLVKLANRDSALAFALKKLGTEILELATAEPDPFGWLLAKVNVRGWSNRCRKAQFAWMTRVWLAAASHLLAQRRLTHKAHGWSDTWEQLRRSAKEKHIHVSACKLDQIHTKLKRLGFRRVAPGVFRTDNDSLRFRKVSFFYHPTESQSRCVVVQFNPALGLADEYFFSQLRHANRERRADLLRTSGFIERLAKARHEGDESLLRRHRRALKGAGKRAGVAQTEKFLVQYWLQLEWGLPGLCFFSDSALHALLAAFGLGTGNALATKQIRERLGLLQAGVKRHLIEQVAESAGSLRVNIAMHEPYVIDSKYSFEWDHRQLWPRPSITKNNRVNAPDITSLLKHRDDF